MTAKHSLQSVILVLQAAGYETNRASPYKLLWQLCSLRGVYINSSAGETSTAFCTTTGAAYGLGRVVINKQANRILIDYIKTGQLSLPAHFTTRNLSRTAPIHGTSGALTRGPTEKEARWSRREKKMEAIKEYAKEHGCSITQATIALM